MAMIGQWWCRNFHRRTLRPIHGHYVCAATQNVLLHSTDLNSRPHRRHTAVLVSATKHWPQRHASITFPNFRD
jgi:hypothetical protein